MKKILILFSVLVSIAIQAQNAPLNYPKEIVNGQEVYLYRVEKSIGLYRISVNFGVSQEEIIKWNPQLRERGLFYNELLRIPVKKTSTPQPNTTPTQASPKTQETPKVQETPKIQETPKVQEAPKAQETPKIQEVKKVQEVRTAPIQQAESAVSVVLSPTPSTKEDTLRIAILLPLFASHSQREASAERFIEFYEGALLAINEIQKSGQKMDIYVYDTEKTDAVIQQLIANGSLDKVEAIIGPTYPIQVAAIAPFVKEKQIPTFIPFTNQIKEIENNPFLMQFNPSSELEAAAFVKHLQQIDTDINCVLIEANEADIPKSILDVRKAIAEANIPTTTTNIHRILADSLTYDLKENANNIIIFNTEKLANIKMMLPHLNTAKEQFNITLFSHYSWQKEELPIEQIYTSVFDPDPLADFTEYIQMWNQYFGHEHCTDLPRYDLLGYDITRQLLAFLMGKEYFGLQSDIYFEKLYTNGGYQNTNIHIIRK